MFWFIVLSNLLKAINYIHYLLFQSLIWKKKITVLDTADTSTDKIQLSDFLFVILLTKTTSDLKQNLSFKYYFDEREITENKYLCNIEASTNMVFFFFFTSKN